MTTDPVVIASYARTPMGGFGGDFAGTSSVELGSAAVKAALERASLDGDKVEKIFMGCVPCAMRCAMRCVNTRVLPEPAPATTNNGPLGCTTASRWSGLRAARSMAVGG